MAIKIDLKTLLKRQKEVFASFCRNGGNIYGLKDENGIFLIDKYTNEDNVKCTEVDIKRYYSDYTLSKNITAKEIQKLNEAKKARLLTECKRGEELVKVYISSFANSDALKPYGIQYAKEDGKLDSYTLVQLKKFIKLYSRCVNDKKLINIYNMVEKISKENDNYNVDLITSIIEYSSSIDENNREKEVVEYIKALKISKDNITNLLEIYKYLYPADIKGYKFVLGTIDLAYQEDNTNKYVQKNTKYTELEQKTLAIIDEYLIGNISYISDDFLWKYQMSRKYFNEMLKDLAKSKNKITKMQVEKYYKKINDNIIVLQPILEEIIKLIINGVEYNGEIIPFNIYHWYDMSPIDIEGAMFYSWMCLSRGETNALNKIKLKLEELHIYSSVDDFMEHYEEKITMLELSYKEQMNIIKYMDERKFPLSVELFVVIANMIKRGFLVIPDYNEQKVNNL